MLIKIDSAQLEWRIAVWLSGDQLAINELNTPGCDIHEDNRIAFTLPSRLISKKYLFRTIFRGSGYAFSVDNEFKHVSQDPDYWDDVNEKFYKKYKGLNQWHLGLSQLVAARKPIVSPLGREWLILPLPDGKLPWTQFTNHPVQGTGADLMALARVSLHRRMRNLGLRALMVSTVHDDIKVDAPEEEVDLVAKTAIEVFNDIPKNVKKLFNIDLPIPFPGEVSVGRNLKDMEKYK